MGIKPVNELVHPIVTVVLTPDELRELRTIAAKLDTSVKRLSEGVMKKWIAENASVKK
jgi:hypothetical protein